MRGTKVEEVKGYVVYAGDVPGEVAIARDPGGLIFWRGSDAIAFFRKGHSPRWLLKKAQKLLDKWRAEGKGPKGALHSKYEIRRATLIIEEAKK